MTRSDDGYVGLRRILRSQPAHSESGCGAFVQQFLDESNQLGVLERFREKSLAGSCDLRTM